jgi:hypothetical protein
MLAPTNGNLSEVFAECWRMFDVAAQAEADMNRLVALMKGIVAEIGDDDAPCWYLVRTKPGEDMRALRWLARRRFGVFRPMAWRTIMGWGGEVISETAQPIFTGWLFVRVYDIAKMAARIQACPGVINILSDAATLVPVPINDRFVDELEAMRWTVERAGHAERRGRRQRKRRRRPRAGKTIVHKPQAAA